MARQRIGTSVPERTMVKWCYKIRVGRSISSEALVLEALTLGILRPRTGTSGLARPKASCTCKMVVGKFSSSADTTLLHHMQAGVPQVTGMYDQANLKARYISKITAVRSTCWEVVQSGRPESATATQWTGWSVLARVLVVLQSRTMVV